MSAHISEIYKSVQGEGPFTGEPQLFLRIAGCPLRCNYCDTPESLTAKGHPTLSVNEVLGKLKDLSRQEKIETVSVTGGEPLAHVSFLKDLFPELKKVPYRIYLETAGIHPKALSEVVGDCDVIAMDMKLPSAVGRPYWEDHREFLKVGAQKVFVKVVVEARSGKDEIQSAIDLVANESPSSIFVFQPVTSHSPDIQPPSENQLTEMIKMAREKLSRVRVMPQQHKIWGIR